jgi:hypothetical protein
VRTSIDRDSVEYLHVPITTPAGSDLTGVQLAVITAPTRPASGDWATATWDDQTREATILLGPLATPGVRSVWVRVTDNPETPVFNAGNIAVT